MWYAGIDWADTHHDALVIDEKGGQVASLRVDHTPQGMSKLNTFLEQIIGTAPKEQMACIIETTHGLLIAHLLEAGWPVYPVNPRTVDRRRSASGAKTDTIDAYWASQDRTCGPGRFAPPYSRQREGERTQATHTRSRCLDPDANAPGQSAHCLTRNLLPSGPGVVYQTAAKEHLGVLANLPDPTSSAGGLWGTN